MPKHENTGKCDKCLEILGKFPGFHKGLEDWFKALQKKVPDAHVSCGGRGKADQEDAFKKGTSKAHYGKSAHNFNLALDIFRLTMAGAEWPKEWFRDKVGTEVFKHNASPEKKFDLEWYGKPGSKFYELPHLEVDDWREMAARGEAKLVEVEKEEVTPHSMSTVPCKDNI